MSSKPPLKLDWCTQEAATYAVEKWHYSRRMPKSKLVKVGVWEGGRFVGCVIFGNGATPNLLKPYGLGRFEGCELVRVALTRHRTPVSRIVAVALRMLKAKFPRLRLVVSFADPDQGHVGTIYQAGGWVFAGRSVPCREFVIRGRRWHPRALNASKPAHLSGTEAARAMDPNFQVVMGSAKLRYLMPLDAGMREQLKAVAKPYPKRATSIAGDAPADQAGEGGSIPTVALLLLAALLALLRGTSGSARPLVLFDRTGALAKGVTTDAERIGELEKEECRWVPSPTQVLNDGGPVNAAPLSQLVNRDPRGYAEFFQLLGVGHGLTNGQNHPASSHIGFLDYFLNRQLPI